REHPSAVIAVTGCDTETNEDYWLKEGSADLVIPGSQKQNIDKYLLSQKKSTPDGKNIFSENVHAQFPFKSRPLLKIQEGCDCFCSFCIVPFARGKPRSRNASEITDEAKKLVDEGHKEIVLTGVNICRYKDGDINLLGIVERLLGIDADFRLRLSSTELDDQLRRIINIMKRGKRLCRFLHVPLQHGSDIILRKMKRPHLSAEFANFAEFAISEIPGIHIGTDLICGLPGESEDIFEESLRFISKIPFANIHIFRYSKREGTEAANFADLPKSSEVKMRMRRLENVKRISQERFLLSQIGSKATFIGEKKDRNGFVSGWSDNYIRTTLSASAPLEELLDIKFTSNNSDLSMQAEIVL
ncbi:MAG TPA: MiaB/RimO family radical SAM methylthiotransferase, partial [Victivallales bacterium]|nr:MiaB/RimO family radical SAM methylthiotransferase [Victivallales bacterium]